MLETFKRHWRAYLMEAAGLVLFAAEIYKRIKTALPNIFDKELPVYPKEV
jgi:hypothetical protein